MALAEVDTEMAAWERYRSYVTVKCDIRNYHGVFCGDDVSRDLWRNWKAARVARDMVCDVDVARRRHRQHRWPT